MLNLYSTAVAIATFAAAGFDLVPLTPQAEAQEQTQAVHDASQFRALYKPIISPDGTWVAAEERSDQGDVNVRVWSTNSDAMFNINRGQNPRISRDSRWVSVLQKSPLAKSKTTSPKYSRGGQTLVLLDLYDGSQRTFDHVLSYDVTFTSSYLLYYQSAEMKAGERDEGTRPAGKLPKEKRKLGTLHAVHLDGDRVFTIRNVAHYLTHLTYGNHQTNDHFGYVLHDRDTGRDTLYMALLNPGRDKKGNYGIRGTFAGNKIEGLHWANDNATVVFLDQTVNASKDGKPPVSSALYTWHDVPGRAGQRVFARVDNRK